MVQKVEVVADGHTFEVPDQTQKRWPKDFPLAQTKAGRPTAAARRAAEAKPAPKATPAVADTTKTAGDLLAEAHAGDGDDTTKEAH